MQKLPQLLLPNWLLRGAKFTNFMVQLVVLRITLIQCAGGVLSSGDVELAVYRVVKDDKGFIDTPQSSD